MKPLLYSLMALCLFSIVSCSKDLSLEGQVPPPPTPEVPKPPVVSMDEALTSLISSGRFQLRAYYADKPIDYIENDSEIKLETNLWGYVSEYLKDDYNTFYTDSTAVTIEQNAIKMDGLSDPVLYKKYRSGKDADGIYMKFLDNKYTPLKYRLFEVGADYFIVAFPWKDGATLYSKFQRV